MLYENRETSEMILLLCEEAIEIYFDGIDLYISSGYGKHVKLEKKDMDDLTHFLKVIDGLKKQ